MPVFALILQTIIRRLNSAILTVWRQRILSCIQEIRDVFNYHGITARKDALISVQSKQYFFTFSAITLVNGVLNTFVHLL